MAEIETIDGGGQTENDVHQRPKTSKSVILEEKDEEEKVSKKPKSKHSLIWCFYCRIFQYILRCFRPICSNVAQANSPTCVKIVRVKFLSTN